MGAIANLVDLIGRVLFPVALFIGAGVLLRRYVHVDPRPLSRVALYVFTPALVFATMTEPGLPVRDLAGIAIFAALIVVGALLLSHVAGWGLKLARSDQAGFTLVTAFSNSSNLGLPLVAFGLGQKSLHAAVVFVLTQIVLVNTVGAYLAGRGGVDSRAAFNRMIRLPALWALALAGVLTLFHVPAPQGLERAAMLGGNAYAPTVLVVLGCTIADWKMGALRNSAVWVGTGFRLLLMPVFAFALVALLPLTEPTAKALVLQIGMPVAINAILLSQEFGAGPEQVAQTITVSTVASALTIPALLAFLPFVR